MDSLSWAIVAVVIAGALGALGWGVLVAAAAAAITNRKIRVGIVITVFVVMLGVVILGVSLVM